MSRRNKKLHRIKQNNSQEAKEMQEKNNEQTVSEAEQNKPKDQQGEIINLEDVGYMVMVGRYKNGEPFFTYSGVSDMFVVDGLLEYAKRQLNHTYSGFFFERDKKRELEKKVAEMQAKKEAEQEE